MAKQRSLKHKVFFFLVKLFLCLFLLSILWVLTLKYVPVFFTPLTIKRSIEYRSDDTFKTQLRWRSYDKISPEMAKAVIASEDNLFDLHQGFDWTAIGQAIDERRSGKRKRGASTISQQTAKNVFCIPSSSWTRKGLETYYTFLIEKFWSKERIMEVYLNVAEMGKGIYGAEAATQHYFSKHASELTQREACLIAACLPSPLKRDPSKPTDYLNKRVRQIISLESKLSYPSWVMHKELTQEEAAKEAAKRQEKRQAMKERQKQARENLLKTP